MLRINTIEYLIRWEGKDNSFDEWKTSGELPDAQKMIQEYNNSVEKFDVDEKKRQQYLPEIADPDKIAEIIRLEEGYPLSTTTETVKKRRAGNVLESIISNLNFVIYELLKDIHKTDKIIPQREKDEIIELYHTLTEQNDYSKEKNELDQLNSKFSKIKTLPFFFGGINVKRLFIS